MHSARAQTKVRLTCPYLPSTAQAARLRLVVTAAKVPGSVCSGVSSG